MTDDYSEEDILAMMQSAVMDTFECGNCGSPLECDCSVCGNCGWKNPLMERGLI